jgi:hypothetical protein
MVFRMLALRRSLGPRIKLCFRRQLFPQFLFRGGGFGRHHDLGHYHQVAKRTVALFQAAVAYPQFLPAGGAGGDLDIHARIQGWHGDLRAQRGLPRRQFQFVDQVVPVNVEVWMLRATHAQIQVAGAAAIAPAFAAPAQPPFLPFADAGGNLDLMLFIAVGMADVHRAH